MIAIVTDSSVYMTRNEAKSLGVWLVPLTYTVNGHIYNETFIGENGDFQRLVFRSNVACQTAHANIAAFMSTFSELVNSGFEVLCITISSRLSGTYSSASIAAREVSSDGKVNTGDAVMLLKHVAGTAKLNEQQLAVADFNGDNKVNTGDATAILLYIVKQHKKGAGSTFCAIAIKERFA
jgi:fatty acid-binding protein DegV